MKLMMKLGLFVLLLVSCSTNINSNTINNNYSENTSSTNEQNSSEVTSSLTSEDSISYSNVTSNSEEIKYDKDKDGFYILDANFFKEDNINEFIKYPNSIDKSLKAKNMKLFANEKEIPLYNVKVNTSQTWDSEAPYREDNAAATIELKGEITFYLQCNFYIKNDLKIRPLSKNVNYETFLNERVVKFKIKETGQYVIEFRNHKTLHLFVNEYNQYKELKELNQYIYFKEGLYNSSNCQYIGNDNLFHLNSNQKIFIDLGAVLQCGFISSNSTNIEIVGNGVIDTSIFPRSASNGSKLLPFEFNYCTNLKFKGITSLDPAGWAYNLYFSSQIEIDNIKIISSRSNGDGISLQSCQNVNVTNSFVRTWDDSLVVKNYPRWDNMSMYGTTKDIFFDNIIIWTDLAQSMEIGYETYGKIMNNINFTNITVLHNFHKAVMSIHNGNNADINQVKFENVIVEDASIGQGDGNTSLIELTTTYSSIWSNGHGISELGSINNITFKNINFIKGTSNYKIRIIGCIDNREQYKNSIHKITNVKFINVNIYGNKLDNTFPIEQEYTENIIFQ